MDPFFVFIIAIVSISCVAGVLKAAITARHGSSHNREELDRIQEDLERSADERFSRIEERLANMETIVLDLEKHSKFDRAL